MRGNRYNTVDRNFDGAVPPQTGGNQSPSPAEVAKQRLEDQKKKQEETRQSEKARAMEFAKKRALEKAEKEKPVAPEAKNVKPEKPDEDEIHAEEKPAGKKVVWNPNSKYAGMGRVIQHVKPLKWASDKIINMGNRYADEEVEYDEDNFGFMSLASKAGTKMGSVAKAASASIAKSTKSIASKATSVVKKTPLMSKTNLVPKPSLASTAIGPVTKPTIAQSFGVGKPLMGKTSLVPPKPGIGASSPMPNTRNPMLGNNVGDKVTNAGPLNKTDQLAKNNADSIKKTGLPQTNTTGNATTAAQRAANKAKNAGLQTKSNVGSTVSGILGSKLKSAAVGAGAGAAINAAQGKNPVTGALGGAAGGVAISHLAKNFSFLDNMPSIVDTQKELLRDKLIANGYSKELSIIDKTEAKERKKDNIYLKSKKIVDEFLHGQRTKTVNLKGNRAMLLKKLSNPKDDRLYTSLSLLYFHCENSQI